MLLTLYQHHIPGEVRIFRYLSPAIRMDDEVIVCDGWSSRSPHAYCRSHMFLQRWLHVFATFGADLTPREDHIRGFSFAFNCDITTPHHRVSDRVYTTDLCVDVLVSGDGRRCLVKDGEALVNAYRAHEFGQLWYEGALRETAWVEGLVMQGGFVSFLETAAPFPKVTTPGGISEMTRDSLGRTRFLFHPDYPRYA